MRRFGNDFHSWLVKIFAESPHSWQKIVIHGNSCIILYILTAWRGASIVVSTTAAVCGDMPRHARIHLVSKLFPKQETSFMDRITSPCRYLMKDIISVTIHLEKSHRNMVNHTTQKWSMTYLFNMTIGWLDWIGTSECRSWLVVSYLYSGHLPVGLFLGRGSDYNLFSSG